ncbi:MAG: hypothetical protein H6774_03180 [Pseudomonadales bacterium]|nr:hypothetical protein [Pseudomonadales bacterium]
MKNPSATLRSGVSLTRKVLTPSFTRGDDATLPDMQQSPEFLRQQEHVISLIRQFFSAKGFREFMTPVLQDALPLEENLYSFQTTWQTTEGNKQLYLPTSPESYLKKQLATGSGNCFSVAHSFRNLEQAGTHHSPEFLMLEWYREGANWTDIMHDVQDLFAYILSTASLPSSLQFQRWETLSLDSLFQERLGTSLKTVCERDALFELAHSLGYTTADAAWSQMFDQVFLNEIEPHLPQTPFFLVDFPVRISRLCQVQSDKPWLAERFEVYAGGLELGNGNTEELDHKAVLAYFKNEEECRGNVGISSHPIDAEFVSSLEALSHTGKSYAGIGMGVGRVVEVVRENSCKKIMRQAKKF